MNTFSSNGKSIHTLLLILLALLIAGCSGNTGPIEPAETEISIPAELVQFKGNGPGNRYMWGMWEVCVSANHLSASVIPVRSAGMHVNTVGFLEKFPCTNCFQIENLTPFPGNKLSADLTLIHPFPGLPKLTGFDVRGILVTEADFNFPISDRWIGWGEDIPRMLLPNGYTQLFNPWEYPSTGPGAALFKYIDGKFSTGGILESTLNPYIAYKREEPRRMFEAGSSETRTIQLHVPDGPFKFGYIVDACWVLVDGPVTDPVNDFPPDANCLEAYRVDVQVGSDLQPVTGSTVPVEVNIFDHQGLDTISIVSMEAPDLFDGEIQLEYLEDTGTESHMFIGDLPNDHGAGTGEYPLLIRVVDTQEDENLGQIDAWFLYSVNVGIRKGWAINWGGSAIISSDVALDVDCDSSGNIYAVGRFYFKCDFDPGPGIEMYYGTFAEAFLVKYDQNGLLVWARKWGAESHDCAEQIEITASDVIYVVSSSSSETIDLDPGPGTDMKSGGSFLSRFDCDGNYVWGLKIVGGYSPSNNCLDSDTQDNALVAGSFVGERDFDPGEDLDIHTPVGYRDCCVTKFDSSGDFVWARTWGGPGGYFTDEDTCHVVSSDSSGRVYVAGRVSDVTDFDPGPGVDEHEAGYFLTSFTQNGDYIAAYVSNVTYIDLKTDEGNNLYILGRLLYEPVDLDPGPGVDIHEPPGMFLSLISQSGEYQWGMSWGQGLLKPDSMVLSNDGYIYIAGDFSWYLVDFAPGPLTDYHGTNGGLDNFLTKLFLDGEYQWTRTWGSVNNESANGVATDTHANAYVCGDFNYPTDFDPGPGVDIHIPDGDGDAFLSKIPPDGNW